MPPSCSVLSGTLVSATAICKRALSVVTSMSLFGPVANRSSVPRYIFLFNLLNFDKENKSLEMLMGWIGVMYDGASASFNSYFI